MNQVAGGNLIDETKLRAQIEASQSAMLQHGQAVSSDDLNAALDQIDNITGTFDALLRLSRIESGAGRERFRPVNLQALAKDVIETFGAVVEDAGQSIVLEIDAPACIQGDWNMLKQAIANLLQNALRHGAENQTISMRVHRSQLSVTDQGAGIPFAEREKVLQPLYQSQSARQTNGYGLGLSLVRAIAELHGADLSLSDGPTGTGLKATLRFQEISKM